MRHRLALILPVYLVLFSTSLLAAYLIRFEFRIPAEHWDDYFAALPLFLVLKFAACLMTREWERTFRHATINDALITASSCMAAASIMLFGHSLMAGLDLSVPRSVILIDLLVSIMLIFVFRIECRLLWKHMISRRENLPQEAALIFGNDETAVGIWKMLSSSSESLGRYRVVGFIDPSPECQRSLIVGQPVYSLAECWEQAVSRGIKHILVPTTISGRVVRELLYHGQEADINIHKIPTVEEIVEGRFRLAVRDLDIDDLLRRPPTQLDQKGIGLLITGKTVLVTGGAGSIGSELCRQILDHNPARLIVLDHSEFGVFQIEREFAGRKNCQTQIQYVTASILDADALETVFATYSPELVFHAAAYKHVPLMQDNPYAAIRNNVLGTKAVVDAAHRHHAERFVLISTDKAVRPTSVMGATKLMAEKYLQAMSKTSQTKFITVRFGNVLNSVGSVVPTFRRQIELGGPVTVTHPDMVRYFMTIPEAVQLVLQAGAVGKSGHVLILDMGDPVKIVDLAKDMITLSGLNYPEDIDIAFTGLRPGEKMYEELFYEHEQGGERVHEKIILGSGYAPTLMQINLDITTLTSSLLREAKQISTSLWDVVNRYVDLDDQESRPADPAISSAA